MSHPSQGSPHPHRGLFVISSKGLLEEELDRQGHGGAMGASYGQSLANQPTPDLEGL